MKITEIIGEAIRNGRTRFALELLPPLKGEGTEGVFAALDALMEVDPAYVNVTFHREALLERTLPDGRIERHTARRRPGTVGISAAIRDRYGVETVPHLICGGLSRYDIEDALIDMDFLGLHNVLALRGDKSPAEAHFTPHPEGHAHADGLVAQIAAMNRGVFVDSQAEVCAPSHFCVGVAGYPETHAEAPDARSDTAWLKRKIEAGAEYVVTQLFYDNRRFFDFVDRCRRAGIDVPIIPGIKPLTNIRQVDTLPRVFGIGLPDELAVELHRHADDPQAVRTIGAEWAIAQVRELKQAGLPVIHFYTMGRAGQTLRIAKSVF